LGLVISRFYYIYTLEHADVLKLVAISVCPVVYGWRSREGFFIQLSKHKGQLSP